MFCGRLHYFHSLRVSRRVHPIFIKYYNIIITTFQYSQPDPKLFNLIVPRIVNTLRAVCAMMYRRPYPDPCKITISIPSSLGSEENLFRRVSGVGRLVIVFVDVDYTRFYFVIRPAKMRRYNTNDHVFGYAFRDPTVFMYCNMMYGKGKIKSFQQ